MPIPLPRTEKQNSAYKNPDNDPRGPWKATDSTCNKSKSERPNLYYPIRRPDGKEILPLESRVWRYSQDVHEKKQSDDRVWWGKEGTNETPAYKSFLTEVKAGRVPTTIWDYSEAGHNQSAKQELNDLIVESPFSTPKPTKLIQLAAAVAIEPYSNEIVLDFFSGSGTTAHAIMALNATDGGNRRHIQVQIPEPCDEKSGAAKAGYQTIADIGIERIRRAGRKIHKNLESQLEDKLPGSDEHEEIKRRLESLDTGIRVLKIDSSNMTEVYYQPDELSQDALDLHVDNVKEGRGHEDLLFQVLLDWGVDLGLPITEETVEGKKVFFVADNALAACFDTGLTEEFCKALAKREPLRAVFRDAGYANDSAKINIEQIFKALSPHTELKTL